MKDKTINIRNKAFSLVLPKRCFLTTNSIIYNNNTQICNSKNVTPVEFVDLNNTTSDSIQNS